MQVANAPLKWLIPWAQQNTSIIELPETTSDPNRASQRLGFPANTMLPPESGGVPPQGIDFNAGLYQVARITWWLMYGAPFAYDATFATNSAISGYAQGAQIASSDYFGAWLNTTDNNQINPDTTGTGWVPGYVYGATTVALAGANVTLTPLQAAKTTLVFTGTLTANVIVTLPAWVYDWTVYNQTTGAFTLTVITAGGTGIVAATGVTSIRGDGTNIVLASPYLRNAIGAALRTLQSKSNDTVSVLDFTGVVGDGVNDDTTGLQNAITIAAASNLKLRSTGLTHRLTAKLTIPCVANVDFTGSTIVADPLITSGYSVSIGGPLSVSTGTYPGIIKGLRVVRALTSGHANTSSNVDGVSFDANGGQASNMGIYDLTVVGFRDNIAWNGPGTFILYFSNIQSCNFWRRGLAAYASSNSGENINFHGGAIYNGNNTSFNGTGVYTDPGCTGWEWNFHSVSIDYCDISATINQGKLELNSCHLENNNNNPHIQLIFTASKPHPTLIMRGGLMIGGSGTNSWTGIPVESTNGRPAYVVSTVGGTNVVIDRTQCSVFRSAENVTEISNIGTGGSYQCYDVRPTYDGGAQCPHSYAMNELYVSTTALTGWTQNTGGGATLSFDTTTVFAPDVGSRKIVGTAGNTSSFQQTLPCRGGNNVFAKAYINATTVTAGSLYIRLDFLAPDGVTVIQTIISSQQFATATSGFQTAFISAVAPPGTASMRYQDFCNAFTGTGYFSNEHVWVY